MSGECEKCGKNLALVGRSHVCTPRAAPVAVNTASAVNTRAVNNPRAVNKVKDADRSAVNVAPADVAPRRMARGQYPNTDARREYMRDLMRKRRAKT